jgi:hypothetical protein
MIIEKKHHWGAKDSISLAVIQVCDEDKCYSACNALNTRGT